jgi:hypothetical protein
MTSEKTLLISLDGLIKSFDNDRIIDFYWPLDNKKSVELMKNWNSF